MNLEKELEKLSLSPSLPTFDLDGIVTYIQEQKISKIIVLTGAGISTSAGIPDFRTPGTGLYDNLQKYELPYPEAIFELDYFRVRPEPFFTLAKELFPGHYSPTPSHYFIKLLADKKLLLRNYTQNIDGLERLAGIDEGYLVEAHGTFSTAKCINADCQKDYSFHWMKEEMKNGIPKCLDCKDPVKPDIVFFGESLPLKFHDCLSKDFEQCELLMVMGTSLLVQPFAGLVDLVKPHVPRLVINREVPRYFRWQFPDRDFDSSDDEEDTKSPELSDKHQKRDVFFTGDCDDACRQLADKLGFLTDLNALL
jgi:NAD-dependent deacetylase sirtuin 2